MTAAARARCVADAGGADPDADGLAAVEPVAVLVLARAAAELEPVALAELGAAALLERHDTKYLLPAAELPALLRLCAGQYRALEVGGVRLPRYHTVYLDTPDLALYHAHHAGRLPRVKARVRSYVDAGTHFLEVKRKANTGRTSKLRAVLRTPADALADPAARALLAAAGLDPRRLRETASVRYRRLTLVARGRAERVTIDVGLVLSAAGRAAEFGGLAIVEVKQPRPGRSPCVEALRALGARQASVSKYCLTVAALVERAKTNRYKPVLRLVYRTTHRTTYSDARLAPAR